MKKLIKLLINLSDEDLIKVESFVNDLNEVKMFTSDLREEVKEKSEINELLGRAHRAYPKGTLIKWADKAIELSGNYYYTNRCIYETKNDFLIYGYINGWAPRVKKLEGFINLYESARGKLIAGDLIHSTLEEAKGSKRYGYITTIDLSKLNQYIPA